MSAGKRRMPNHDFLNKEVVVGNYMGFVFRTPGGGFFWIVSERKHHSWVKVAEGDLKTKDKANRVVEALINGLIYADEF